jgi:FixJ family two-component response regulator
MVETLLLCSAGHEVRFYCTVREFLLERPANTRRSVELEVCMPGRSGHDREEAFGKMSDTLPIIFLTPLT